MNCNTVLSRLQAYADAELNPGLMREIEEHLDACPSCRSRVEQIRRVGDVLDSLRVPPLPEGFTVRVMVGARKRATVAEVKQSFPPFGWQPVRWLIDLSFSMRLAACAMVFLACFLGVFMSKELSPHDAIVAEAENLEGLEWFSPTPPASLGSAYVSMAWTTPEERDGR